MGQQTSSKCSVAKAVGVWVPVAGKAGKAVVGSWVPVDVGSFLFLNVLHLSSSLLLFNPRNRTGDGRKIISAVRHSSSGGIVAASVSKKKRIPQH